VSGAALPMQGLEGETRGVRLGVRPREIGLGAGQPPARLFVTLRSGTSPLCHLHGICREQAAEDVAPLARDGAQRVASKTS